MQLPEYGCCAKQQMKHFANALLFNKNQPAPNKRQAGFIITGIYAV
jgi:hypothetical protein